MPDSLWMESETGLLYTKKQRDRAQLEHCRRRSGRTHLEFESFDKVTGKALIGRVTTWRKCPRKVCSRKYCWQCIHRWTCCRHASELDAHMLFVTGEDECECPGRSFEGQEDSDDGSDDSPHIPSYGLYQKYDLGQEKEDLRVPNCSIEEEEAVLDDPDWEKNASNYMASWKKCEWSTHAEKYGVKCPHWPYGYSGRR